MLRVAINGYGRIGRIAHRIILEKYPNQIEIAAINVGSSTDMGGWANLFKYDSDYGPLKNHEVKFLVSTIDSSSPDDNEGGSIGSLIVDGIQIPVFSQKDPLRLPWKDLNIDIVIESSGKLTTEEKLKAHLTAGAKTVVESAPAKEGNVATYVISVNDRDYHGEKIISNASCTTNCIAPIVKIMLEHFGVEKAMLTTIHAYTSDQNLLDGGHKDYRRARAATQNIIPTSTGAAKATSLVLPALKGLFTGLAIRVPVPVGSLSDITFVLKRNTTKEEINDVFQDEAENPFYKSVLEVTKDPIVSSDIIGNPHSAIVDLSLTQVIGGNLAKVIAWYDNEYGYANRLVEEVLMVGRNMQINASKPKPQEPNKNNLAPLE